VVSAANSFRVGTLKPFGQMSLLLLNERGFLFIGPNNTDFSNAKADIENLSLSVRCIKDSTPPLGNLGAIYGKLAAQVFLNKMQNFKAPVDTLQQMLWQHNVQTWSSKTKRVFTPRGLLGIAEKVFKLMNYSSLCKDFYAIKKVYFLLFIWLI
jgi:hypothetical protein